jgi:sRNA-binding carbon storage regulator CsrA
MLCLRIGLNESFYVDGTLVKIYEINRTHVRIAIAGPATVVRQKVLKRRDRESRRMEGDK